MWNNMINQLVLEGRVLGKPEVNDDETKVEFYSLNYRDFVHDGVERESTDMYRIVSFNNEKNIARLLKNGDRVIITGVLNTLDDDVVQIIADEVIEAKKSL